MSTSLARTASKHSTPTPPTPPHQTKGRARDSAEDDEVQSKGTVKSGRPPIKMKGQDHGSTAGVRSTTVASTRTSRSAVPVGRSTQVADAAATNAKPERLKPQIVGVPLIDKLVIALYEKDLADDEAEVVSERLRRLVCKAQSSEGPAEYFRGSTKGEVFARIVIQRLPSGAIIKYALEPTQQNIKQRLQITLNPGHMNQEDAKVFRRTLKKLLGPQWESHVLRFLCTRIDVCIDMINVAINRLLINFIGARSQGVFYVQTGRDGEVETVYCGSAQSATHGIVYNQVASEAFKSLVGEKLLQRRKVSEDAEVAITSKEGRIRLEVRNVLPIPVRLRDVRHMATALAKFQIFHLTEEHEKKLSAHSLGILDTVRLRGFIGGRAHLQRGKHGAAVVAELDELLERYVATWWKPHIFIEQLGAALVEAPVWSVIYREPIEL